MSSNWSQDQSRSDGCDMRHTRRRRINYFQICCQTPNEDQRTHKNSQRPITITIITNKTTTIIYHQHHRNHHHLCSRSHHLDLLVLWPPPELLLKLDFSVGLVFIVDNTPLSSTLVSLWNHRGISWPSTYSNSTLQNLSGRERTSSANWQRQTQILN